MTILYMSNPFEEQIYFICESSLQPNCPSQKVSRITDINENIPDILANDTLKEGYTKTGPMNLLEVKKYLGDESTKLYILAQLAQTCNKAGLDLKSASQVDSIPSACSTTFDNFRPSNLKMVKDNFQKQGNTFSDQLMSFPNPFNNFGYTPEYTDSKKTDNDKKSLCQRYADIGQLLKDFWAILSQIKKKLGNNNQTTEFTDKYKELWQMYDKNSQLRVNLTNKLDTVMNGIYYRDSKQFLDSTVYVSVLWTILATTGVFYLFRTMKE